MDDYGDNHGNQAFIILQFRCNFTGGGGCGGGNTSIAHHTSSSGLFFLFYQKLQKSGKMDIQ